MPEFTYEESDNYLLAQMAKGMSDGKLKRAYFDTLRGIREIGMNPGTRLWLDILTTNLETRGLMANGRIINKKSEV